MERSRPRERTTGKMWPGPGRDTRRIQEKDQNKGRAMWRLTCGQVAHTLRPQWTWRRGGEGTDGQSGQIVQRRRWKSKRSKKEQEKGELKQQEEHVEHQRRVQFEGCVAEPFRTITAIKPGQSVLHDALSEVTQIYPPLRWRFLWMISRHS